MEEFWDNNGPYALAKLADRLVPIPRDNEAQISLYALCRAWVRNNPTLPLLAETPAPQQPESRDSAVQTGGAAGAILNGDELQAAAQLPQAPSQQHQPQQPPAPPPLLPQHDPQPNGLLSILPPVLPPTVLESDTAPPTYPLDDFDAQEPEEALRKFKQHWVAVRQYHQALRAAKLSRHRERLVALLGEPSLLQPPMLQMQLQAPGLVVNPHQALQQQQQHLQQAALLGLQGQVLGSDQIPNGGVPGLATFQGAGLGAGPGSGAGMGLPQGVQAGPISGVPGFGIPPAAAGVVGPGAGLNTAVDAQAALATLMNLGPPIPTGEADASAAGQQLQPQLLHLQQQQPQLGLLGGGAVAAAAVTAHGQMVLPPIELMMALQQQQRQPMPTQPAAAATAVAGVQSLVVMPVQQPTMLGQHSAAAVAAAEAGQGQEQGQGQQPATEAEAVFPAATTWSVDIMSGGTEADDTIAVVAPVAAGEEQQAHVPVPGLEVLGRAGIDAGPPVDS